MKRTLSLISTVAVAVVLAPAVSAQTISGGTYAGTNGTNGTNGASGASHSGTGTFTTVRGDDAGTGNAGTFGTDGYTLNGGTLNIASGLFRGGAGGSGGNGGNGGNATAIGTNIATAEAGDGGNGDAAGTGGNGFTLNGGTLNIASGLFSGGAGGSGGNGGNGGNATATATDADAEAGNGGLGVEGGLGGYGLLAVGSGTVVTIRGGSFLGGTGGTGGLSGIGGVATAIGDRRFVSNGNSFPGASNGRDGVGLFASNNAIIYFAATNFSANNGIVSGNYLDGTAFSFTYRADSGGQILAAPIPEPAFYQMTALLTLSGLGVLRSRRKKAQQ